MKYRYIDAIRGVAILMVILTHTSQVVKMNFLPNVIPAFCQMGVQLFFVASAFTLCLSMANRVSEEKLMLKYSIRRYFRIAPAYYVGIVGYLFLNIIANALKEGRLFLSEEYSFHNVLANVLFVHGFVPSANNSVVPGGWSIGTEMAFYVVFPLLFLAQAKIRDLNIIKSTCLLSTFLGISVLANYYVFSLTGFSVENSSFLYFNLFNQLPVFVVGIIYYRMWKENAIKLNSISSIFAAIFAITAAVFLFSLGDYFSKPSVVPVFVAVSFVFLIEMFRLNNKLCHKFLVRIGEVSYSMYLIHFLFAHSGSSIIYKIVKGTIPDDILLIIFYISCVLFTFLLANLSEKVVEKPFIRYGRTLISRV